MGVGSGAGIFIHSTDIGDRGLIVLLSVFFPLSHPSWKRLKSAIFRSFVIFSLFFPLPPTLEIFLPTPLLVLLCLKNLKLLYLAGFSFSLNTLRLTGYYHGQKITKWQLRFRVKQSTVYCLSNHSNLKVIYSVKWLTIGHIKRTFRLFLRHNTFNAERSSRKLWIPTF